MSHVSPANNSKPTTSVGNRSSEIQIPAIYLQSWITTILTSAGLTCHDATIVAENLVEAECRGVKSHGLILLSVYVKRIREGGIRTFYTQRITQDTGTIVVIDGDGGPGQVLARNASEVAVERTLRFGLSIVFLQNSNHVGMLATYGLQIADAGLTGIVMTNSGPSINAFHGRGRRLGNNALCIAAPGKPEPFVFDMATGTVACGKVRLAALHGQSVPSGWLQDEHGQASTDPFTLDARGSVTPLGGAKGYGLAAVIDIFAALLAGGLTSLHVANQVGNESHPTGASQLFLAIDPERLAGLDTFRDRVTSYCHSLRMTQPVVATVPVLAPGDPELAASRKARQEGIAVTPSLRRKLDELSLSMGCPPLLS